MGRPKRADEAGSIYHMLNRANRREIMFHKDFDYEAFENVLREALDRVDVQLYSYCLMPNHWHLVVSPQVDGKMGRFGQWLCLTHTQRYHAHYDTAGEGHLYQGRYKSFPVQNDEHFLMLCRYVERNALAANLCKQPDQWRYSSLWHWRQGTSLQERTLSPWPIQRHRDGVDWVRMELSEKAEEQLRWCMKRGCPYGDANWTETTARRLNLESTLTSKRAPSKTNHIAEMVPDTLAYANRRSTLSIRRSIPKGLRM